MLSPNTIYTITGETFRWIIGGVFVIFGAILKFEFRRIWAKINQNSLDIEANKMEIARNNFDKSLDVRISALENLVKDIMNDQKQRDKELFNLINNMNDRLHQHIEEAIARRNISSSEDIKEILRNELNKIRSEDES